MTTLSTRALGGDEAVEEVEEVEEVVIVAHFPIGLLIAVCLIKFLFLIRPNLVW